MTSNNRPANTSGFALLAVLWITVGVAALSMIIGMAGSEFIAAVRNRLAIEAATWRAEDCAERALAALSSYFVDLDSDQSGTSPIWLPVRADGAPGFHPPLHPFCKLDIRALGTAFDVNSVDPAILRNLLASIGAGSERSDSLQDALLDWLDSDELPRGSGAERTYYEARGLALPRNGRMADVQELRQVRGWGDTAGAFEMLSVEPARIALNHAPLPVIDALPGITREAVSRISEYRRRGERIEDLLTFGAELSPASRDSIALHYNFLRGITTSQPDAWVLTARGNAGSPVVKIVLEERLVWTGSRIAVIGRRMWIE